LSATKTVMRRTKMYSSYVRDIRRLLGLIGIALALILAIGIVADLPIPVFAFIVLAPPWVWLMRQFT
jgi:hypothetical protein